jgi:hypothetical protein
MSRFITLVMFVWMIVVFAQTRSASAVTYLTNPGVYTAVASSTFSDTPGEELVKLFDADLASSWAIDSFAGNNPQGRDEGWVSVTLNQTYLITHLRFAPRKASGNTDGIDSLSVWVSHTPLAVDVTSATSTQAFLLSPEGGTPDLTIGPFASFAPLDYAFDATRKGKYLLARFLNVSDHNNNRNLGGRALLIGQVGVVPEPSTTIMVASVVCMSLSRRPRPSNLPNRHAGRADE